MARSIFTPWKCGDCGAHGQIRHIMGARPEAIAQWTAEQHARKSPACHQKAAQSQDVLARLTPRDRHILITARIKRKLMADAIRVQRKADPAGTRANWMAGKATRKGYAFT